ncbi:MAG: phage tail assembly chaperone [Aeromonas veronii]
MQQIQKSTGYTPKQLLDASNFPLDMRYMWDIFCELKSAGSIAFSDIKAWCDLMRLDLVPREVQLLRKLDRIHWEVTNDGSGF